MSKKGINQDRDELEYDEWGDPVESKPAVRKRTPNEVDEWGDPLHDDPEEKALYVDEWGDPVARKNGDVAMEIRNYKKEEDKVRLEKQLVREGVIYPRGHYRPHGRLRGVIAILLAFLFGIFVVLGGIVGVGAYFGTTKLSKVFGESVNKYLTEDYADMSIIELITAVAGDLRGGISTLDDISKYTPLVDTLLDKADEYAEQFGVEYDRATLKSTKFGDIWGYVYNDVVKNIAVGKALAGAGFTDPTVLAIFLGEEGVDYTVDEEGKITILESGRTPVTVNDLMTNVMGTLNTVQLGLILGLNKDVTEDKIFGDNAVMYALSYGKYGQDYELQDGRIHVLTDKAGSEGFVFPTAIGDLVNNTNAVVNSLELGSMLGLSGGFTEEQYSGNAVMYALAYGTEGRDYQVVWTEGVGKIEPLEGRNENYPTTVGGLTSGSSDFINTIELGSLLGIASGFSKEDYDANSLMYSLAYGTEGTDYTVEWNNGVGTIVMMEDRKATSVGDLTSRSNEIINGLELGSMLGIGTGFSQEDYEKNTLMYSIAYGAEGTDYTVQWNNGVGTIVMMADKKAKTIEDLTKNSNDLINGLELGSMLGIASGFSQEDYEKNTLMYSIAYGNEGTDYTVEWDAEGKGKVVMMADKKATTVGQLTTSSNDLINGLELGAMLGIASGFSKEEYENNTLMYSIAYGNEGTDYTVEWDKDDKGKVTPLEGRNEKYPTTVGGLTTNSNDLINGLELGTMLGIGSDVTEEDLKENALMFALCYGTRGEDYEIVGGKVVMKEGKTATTVGELTTSSNGLIQGMEVETLMGIKPTSDKLMHYIAYGPEMQKGEIPYTQAGNAWTDAKDRPVDAHGYLLGTDGNYLMEKGEDADGNEIDQYAGGGRYVYTYDGNGAITGVQMLPDPNDPTGKPYPKRTVANLTADDADILGGMKIGDVTEIDEDSSGLMQAMKDWTLDDLKDQSKIESLTIGQLLDVEEQQGETSNIIWALKDKTLAALKDQNTINELQLSAILTIDEDSSGLMRAMQDWKLSDLNSQDKIEGLTIGAVLDVDTSDTSTDSKLMKALAGKTFAELKGEDALDGLTIGEILDVNEDDSKLMKALSGKTVEQLKGEDALNDLTIGEILDVNEDDSKLMKALSEKTVEQLKGENALDDLLLGDILDVDENSSKLMQSLANKQVGDLKEKDTIENLKLGDIIEISKDDTGLMAAMQDWKVSDLKNQNRIERLRIGQIIAVGEETSGFMKTISTWRIKDLSDSSKIESLKLGDVIAIDDETGILAALKDTQIGRLQDGINELTLTQLLGDLSGNTILKGLANSTVASLSHDIQELTVSTIFGDQIYSYMKIEGGVTYQTLYENYFRNHATQHGDTYLPKAYTPNNLETRLFINDKEVLKGYFDSADKLYAGNALRDENGNYYYNSKDSLTVLTEYKQVVYSGTAIDYQPLPETVQPEDILSDDYGGYYYTETGEDGSHTKVEVEKVVTGYTLNGTSLTQGADGNWLLDGKAVEVITEGEQAYLLTRVSLEEKYYEKDTPATTHSLSTPVEKRFYDGTTQLDRYVSGVWFLLLAETSADEQLPADGQEGKPGKLTFDKDPKLTEIATSVSEVNTTLTDTALWKLYFVGVLPDDPAVTLGITVSFTGEHGSRTVTDLSDITISELVPFIAKVSELLNKIPGGLGG